MHKFVGISLFVLSSFGLCAFGSSMALTQNDCKEATENGGGNKSNQDKKQILSTDYEYTVSGLTVLYENNNTTDNDTLTYIWDLGDGSTVSEQVFEHTYETMGSYRTCLNILDKDTRKTIAQKCKDIEILDPNLCDITWDPVCGCDNQTYMNACFAENYHGVYYWLPGPCSEIDFSLNCDFSYEVNDLSVQFINTSVGNFDSYEWDWSDGKTSEQRNPKYTFRQPGIYTVCLTVSSAVTHKTGTACHDLELKTTTHAPK